MPEFDNPDFQGNFDNPIFQGGQGGQTTTPPPPSSPYDRIATFVQQRLRQDSVSLPEASMDLDIQVVVQITLIKFPCLGGVYSALVDPDKLLFDKAVGLMVAQNLRSFVDRRRPATDPTAIQIQQGDTNYRFAPLTAQQIAAQDWLKEAIEALAFVSCIRANALGLLNAFTPFDKVTPSR